MNTPNKCPRCKKETPPNAPEGLCPACWDMNVAGGTPSGAEDLSGTGAARSAPLSVEEVEKWMMWKIFNPLHHAGGTPAEAGTPNAVAVSVRSPAFRRRSVRIQDAVEDVEPA